MKYELLIKEGAEADIIDGFQHYSKISPHLGDDFLHRLDDAFGRILSGPEMFAAVFKEIRQLKIRRFPYVISYTIDVDRIVVLAVLHGGRNPAAWKGRGNKRGNKGAQH